MDANDVPPPVLDRVTAWLATTGKFELRKAKSMDSAQNVAAQLLSMFIDEQDVATLTAEAKGAGMDQPLPTVSDWLSVQPTMRPLLYSNLRRATAAAIDAAHAVLGDKGTLHITLPPREAADNQERRAEQRWHLEVRYTERGAEVAARDALKAAIAALRPMTLAVTHATHQIAVNHLVGRGGRHVRCLESLLSQACYDVVDTHHADISIDVSPERILVTALVLPSGPSTIEGLTNTQMQALRCKLARKLSGWFDDLPVRRLGICNVPARGKRSEPFEEELLRWVDEGPLLLKEQFGAKRERDALCRQRCQARKQAQAKRALARHEHPRRVAARRPAPTPCRLSRAWALEDIERSSRAWALEEIQYETRLMMGAA